ncbi:MAG TPA: enolase C-terminal domain-like protein [Bryobacteraceae bacterium]|jgi:L-rhamnonate dehydratase|nr:enolase C-terminal domain-like protein [Bryobacteraceae bacterium]
MPISRRQFFGSAAAASAFGADSRLKITSVKAFPVKVAGVAGGPVPKFASDFDPGRSRWIGPFSQLGGAILVEIKTDQGLTGYGMGGGGGAAAYIIEHHLGPLITGASPLNVEAIWEQMYNSSLFYGRKGVTIMAMSGVDLALWDIRGKHAGQPVYKLLGGPNRDKVPAYYTGNDIEGALKLGFRAFKHPVRWGVEEGREGMKKLVSELRAIRDKIGPDHQLMIDAICRWNVPYTLEMVDRMQEFRLYWIEEPLSPDNLEGYAQLCREVRGPLIASGEHEYTRFGFEELISHKAVKLLQPDTTWSGGLTEVRRIAQLAAAHSLPVAPHRGGSPYGLAVILTTPSCVLAESFGTLERSSPLMAAMTSRFENGYYFPSDKPGFGVDVTPSML